VDDFFVLFSSLLQEVRIHVLWRDQISAEVGGVWGVVGGEARVNHFLALDTEPGQNESQDILKIAHRFFRVDLLYKFV